MNTCRYSHTRVYHLHGIDINRISSVVRSDSSAEKLHFPTTPDIFHIFQFLRQNTKDKNCEKYLNLQVEFHYGDKPLTHQQKQITVHFYFPLEHIFCFKCTIIQLLTLEKCTILSSGQKTTKYFDLCNYSLLTKLKFSIERHHWSTSVVDLGMLYKKITEHRTRALFPIWLGVRLGRQFKYG